MAPARLEGLETSVDVSNGILFFTVTISKERPFSKLANYIIGASLSLGMHPFQELNLALWPRYRHFQLFQHQAFPYLGVTVEVSVGPALAFCRENKLAFFDAIQFCVLHAANDVEEFRHRIVRDVSKDEGNSDSDVIRLYERVDVSCTLLGHEELFRFAECPRNDNFTDFARESRRCIARAKATEELSAAPRLDLIYTTCLPWFRFSQMLHPVDAPSGDSIPRIAWGKYEEIGGQVLMPLNVQVHHGLVDGLHLGRFYECFGARLKQLTEC